MIKEPIRIDDLTYGYLYFDLDRSAVRGNRCTCHRRDQV